MADETRMKDNWIDEMCAKCKWFKQREGKQKYDRCTNPEVNTGEYDIKLLKGLYFCSEYEYEICNDKEYWAKRVCPMTSYPTNCTDECKNCDCGGKCCLDELEPETTKG